MKKTLLFLVLSLHLLYARVSEGDTAKNFTLHTLDGKKTYSMKDFKGEVVLLNLWASWCKGCKKEIPEFVALQKSYKKGFKLVTVNLDDNPQNAKKFLHSLENKTGTKIPFICLSDLKKSVAKAYKCSAMPSSYLIDKQGKIHNIIVGSLDKDEIEQLKMIINKLK